MKDYGYKVTDSGALGKSFERDVKAFFNQKAVVSKQGKIDFRRKSKCYELKTGAGELDFLFKSKIRYVVYVPVVIEALPVEKQEGFVLERETFLELLEEVGLVRHKVSTSGQDRVTIQTFWNHKLNKAHGKKYFDLLDQLYDKSLVTFDQFMADEGILDEA
jgi:hypothetical protein